MKLSQNFVDFECFFDDGGVQFLTYLRTKFVILVDFRQSTADGDRLGLGVLC